MSSDGTGTQARRAPLPPSARSAGALAGSTRRPSNRPLPKSLFNAAPGPAAREPAGSIPRPSAAAVPASAEGRSAADNARAVRDELVQAVMPELRALVEHLVKTTVERSVAHAATPPPNERRDLEAAIQNALAPLLDRQRDLETALADLRRAELRPQAAPSIVSPRAPEPATSPGTVAVAQPALLLRAAPIPAAVSAAPRPIAAKPLTAAFTAAHDANAAWDIPAELDGSRRKRAVIWILAIAVVLILLSVAGLSVLSNTGRYL